MLLKLLRGQPERVKEVREKAIDYFINRGWFYDAAEFAEKAGLTEKALELYEKDVQELERRIQ